MIYTKEFFDRAKTKQYKRGGGVPYGKYDYEYVAGQPATDVEFPTTKTKRKLTAVDRHVLVEAAITHNIKNFVPELELKTVKENALESEEGDYFLAMLQKLDKLINEMPGSYETEAIDTNEKMVWLHYFSPGSDWFIVEKDKGSPDDEGSEKGKQFQAFGYVILNQDYQNAELGYRSIEALIHIPQVELDLYWTPKKLAMALMEAGHPEYPKTEQATVNDMVKGKSQFELNQDIRALIKEKGTDRAKYSPAELDMLEYYEGGGGTKGEKGARILDQFFTPDLIIQKMWGLALKHGFKFEGSNILEPGVGTGRFLKYITKNSGYQNVDTYEVDETAYSICKILYPAYNHHLASFETMFFNGNRHVGLGNLNYQYDLVIGNPPYRQYVSPYSPLGESDATGADTFDQYFMMRGVDVLKPGGLLIFVIPSSFMFNKIKYNDFKDALIKKADLLEAYRCPSDIFDNTAVTTDIIVLKRK